MNKTIEEMKEAKRDLAKIITQYFHAFESTYDVTIDRIDLYKNNTIGCTEGLTTGVKIEVKI